MGISELDLIKRFKCPACAAKPQHACRVVVESETRIHPFAPGSAADEWVHPQRRNLAVNAGVIREPR